MQPREPENQKNLLLAIVLSMGVLLLWQFFIAGPQIQEQERQRKAAQAVDQTVTPGAKGGVPAPGVTTPGGIIPQAPGAGVGGVVPGGQALTREAAIETGGPRIQVETETLRGSISLKGARLDDLVMPKYRQTVDTKSPAVELFSPADAPHPYFAEYGFVAAAGTTTKLPDRDTVWTARAGAKLTDKAPLVLTWDNGQGLIFTRTIALDAGYMFVITDQVDNKSGAEVRLHPYGRIFREGTPKLEHGIQHEGLIGVIGAAGLQEHTFDAVLKDGGSKAYDKITGGWLGQTEKYWAAAMIPDQTAVYRANLRGLRKKTAALREQYQADYMLDHLTIAAGATGKVEARLYAGAKEVPLIENYYTTLGVKNFDLMIDWGWFYFITKPLYQLMIWLKGLLGNFGLAILTVTVLVKAAFFPFANWSYESMAKMKKLQPEMERIRDRFKDDKQRQQQELMQLYQKEKINPLIGCLPMLLQIPVFFALYKVIFIAIDMRHAPFFGWIKDLSAPDPTSMFNLFGLLPFPGIESYLLGYTIGAWALLMGITMWMQMQLNPQQPDPTQQMVFNWMPVMFTGMLAGFASGLVIYWAWNNILSLAQQYYIMKRLKVDVPLVDNIKKTIAAAGSLFKRGVTPKG